MMERSAGVYPPELLDCKPAAGWLLIKPDDKTNMTTGGIILPDGDENMSALRTGRATACGEGRKMDNGDRTDVPCEPGETVLFTDSNAALVHLEGVQHFLIRFEHVIARAKSAARRFVKTYESPGIVLAGPMPPNGPPHPIRDN